jgi:multidrug resistance protein, MATE family
MPIFMHESSKHPEATNMVSIYTQDPDPRHFKILGLEPILLRRIIQLGLPVIIGMLSQTAINTVDLLFIGRLPEEIAVPGTAAVLSSIILLWAFGGFLSSISVGTQAITARRFSEGNWQQAGRVLTNAIAVSVIASIFIMILAEFLIDPLIALLSPSPAVQQLGTSYSRIRFWGLLSMALMSSYKSFYDGLGRVRIHMTIAILMNIVNITLCYFLIFGFSIFRFTIKPMHVEGAALGAVFSSYSGLLFMIIWSLRKHDRLNFGVYRLKNLNWNVAFAVAKLSFWSGLATVILMAGVGLFNHIVGLIDQLEGVDAINSSAASIIIHVMMLVFMSCLAFGTSTATLVSQSIGAKVPHLAERYGWQSVLLAVYSVSFLGFFAYLFPESILRIFMPKEVAHAGGLKDAVVLVAIPSLKLAIGLLSPLAAAAMVLTQALYGAGKTRYVMIVEFLLHFGCLVPLAWFLGVVCHLGLFGCWLAAVIYAALLLLATGIKFWKGNWKEMVI